jgi:hypothetical protein
MHGFCNFAVFVDEKSRASEHVKRDPHVFDLVPFFCAFAILQIVKDVRRKYVAFQVLAMNLLRRNVVQNARKSAHVQECMGSVILQFSSMKKVGRQNM